jgi:hypothetical protein
MATRTQLGRRPAPTLREFMREIKSADQPSFSTSRTPNTAPQTNNYTSMERQNDDWPQLSQLRRQVEREQFRCRSKTYTNMASRLGPRVEPDEDYRSDSSASPRDPRLTREMKEKCTREEPQREIYIDSTATRPVDPPRNQWTTPIPVGPMMPPPGFVYSHRSRHPARFGPDPEYPNPRWVHTKRAFFQENEGYTYWYFFLTHVEPETPQVPPARDTKRYVVNPSWDGIKHFFGE